MKPVNMAILVLTAAVLAVAYFLPSAGLPAGEGALVVTQIPVQAEPASPGARLDPGRRYPAGSRIVLVSDPGQPEQVRVLSQGLERAGAPDLSPDGRRIVFAGRPSRQSGWTLFEAGIDGRRPVQILRIDKDCSDPAYLAGEQLIFTCAERRRLPSTWSLYTATLTGRDLTRITFGPGSAFDPTPLADGRILFSMVQAAGAGRPDEASALFTINADGTMLAPFAGSHAGPAWKVRPRQTPSGGVIFIAAEVAGPGSLERVAMSRPMATRVTLVAGGILAAEPAAGGRLLVAAWPEPRTAGSSALFQLLPEPGSTLEPLMDDPAYHELEGFTVGMTKQPRARPSAVDTRKTMGTLVCYDTAATDGLHGAPTGKPMRLTAEILPRLDDGGNEPVLLGEVPMADDGSFHIQVPADRPLRMVAVHDGGRRVLSDWFWVRPGEVRTCFGCHENRESAPPNRMVQAVALEAVPLTGPVDSARGGTP